MRYLLLCRLYLSTLRSILLCMQMQTLQPIVSNISKEDMIHFRNKYIKVASYQFTTLIVVGILIETRRHSSGMRTARLLPVSTSMHCFRGVYLPRGCTCSGGVPARGVYLPRGSTCPEGLVPTWGVYLPRYSLPPVDRQTRVKT